jgi:polysaccharide export outer membrane protein
MLRQAALVGLTLVHLSALHLSAQPQAAAEPQVIEVGDYVVVLVAEESSFDVEQNVAPNGALTLPHLGDLVVAGLTTREAAEVISRKLEESYLQRATVNLAISGRQARSVSIFGAVQRPGRLEFREGVTLSTALLDAGGLSSQHGDAIRIERRVDNGLSDTIEISARELLILGLPEVDLPLLPGDEVTVAAATELAVFFMGEVGRPGKLNFKSTDRMTLLTAIAQVGGLTERASKKITVKRMREDGGREEIVVGYKGLLSGSVEDIPLEDQDLILVKESFF